MQLKPSLEQAGALAGGLLAVFLSAASAASEPAPQCQAFFGDLHVHTMYSMDAFVWNLFATPDDAYRFAKGEALIHRDGRAVRRAFSHGRCGTRGPAACSACRSSRASLSPRGPNGCTRRPTRRPDGSGAWRRSANTWSPPERRCGSGCSTWPVRMAAGRTRRPAAAPTTAPRSTWRTAPFPRTRARAPCRRCGRTRTLTRTGAATTTCACWRTPAAAGPPGRPCGTVCRPTRNFPNHSGAGLEFADLVFA